MSQTHEEKRHEQSQGTGEGRRKALKRLILGGGVLASMPDRWTKPVVESVLLPAHAQASPIQPPQPTPTPTRQPTPGGTPGSLQIDNTFRVAVENEIDLQE